MTQVCDDCGKIIALGEWPWCPHARGQNTVVADDVPGGFVVENGFDRPTRFDSHSAHEKALAERGLEIRAKWAGPNDQHLTRWDSVDLDAARALVTPRVTITTTDLDVFTVKDLDAPETAADSTADHD